MISEDRHAVVNIDRTKVEGLAVFMNSLHQRHILPKYFFGDKRICSALCGEDFDFYGHGLVPLPSKAEAEECKGFAFYLGVFL